jgi:hypothetical protein
VGRSFLVDGYNALHQLVQPTPQGIDECRRAILGLVRDALRRGPSPRGGGDLAHVVFDARKGGARAGSDGKDGPVSWSYADGSADDAIVDIVRRNEASHDGRDIVVVTDDRELRGRAKQVGARALRVREWFDRVGAPAPERDLPQPGRSPGLRAKDFGAGDFGLPEGPLDLGSLDPDDL